MKFADLAVSAFLILFPLAWLASSAYGTWKEYHRHIEQIRECPAYTLLYQFFPKDTGKSKVK